MKISKKLLSLVLCVAMLVSATAYASMTSAPQTDAKDLVLISEGFTSTGTQTMVKRGVAGASDQTEYYSVATFTPNLKTGSTVDYYMNLAVTNTGNTTKNNYAGFRKDATRDIKDGLFSVSYDIRFNSVQTSGMFIRLTGKNIIASSTTEQYGINRTIFDAVADTTKVGLWDEHSDYTIDVGTWYNVHHLFDTKTGYEYMTVTNPDNEVISITPQSIPASLKNTVKLKQLTISSPAACDYDIDNIIVKDESVSLESTADSFLASENVTLTATIPEGFEKAFVMADGDVVGQITPVSGKNVYDITIPASDLGFGNHELILSASYPDGITRTNATTVIITQRSEKAVSSTNAAGTLSTTADNLNHLFTSSMTSSDKISIAWNHVENNTEFCQTTGSNYLIPGASGEAGDYAVSVEEVGKLFQIRYLAKPIVSSGKMIIEFDILIGENTNIYSENIGHSVNLEANFIYKNNIFQNVPINPNEWTHVMLVYDTSAGSFTAYANGTSYTTGRTLDLTLGYFRFALAQGSIFAIDNPRIYNLVTDPVVNSAAYVTASGETETTGAIPANATAIKLYMSEAVDVTASDVALYADGEAVNATDVSSANGVVTISLPALKANTDLKVVLNKELSQSFYVTDNGSFFKASGLVTSGNTATAVIRHMGSGTSRAIVATYNGNELVSINVCDFKSAAGIGAVNASVSKAGADEIKIMAWNDLSSATPKMTAASYNIN